MDENVFRCSTINTTSLPDSVPINTTWMTLKNSGITKLCQSVDYLSNIKALDLRSSRVSLICKSFAKFVMKNRNDSIDLYPLDQIWLSDNPYHCDCKMTWMIGWLNTYTTPSGQHIIVDFNNLTCRSGMMKGRKISTLTAVEMGCFPKELTHLQLVGIAMGAGVSLIIIGILLFVIVRRSREVRLFLFNKFNLNTITEDRNENFNKLKYDAFFSFW